MTAARLNVEQQHALCQEIADALAEEVTGWDHIELSWSSMEGYGALINLVIRDAGTGASRGGNVSRRISKLCARLKMGMYEPGIGAWFTMKIELRVGEPFHVIFDYENEPRGGAFILEHYAQEIARFHRGREHVPAWLQGKLDRVPNVYVGLYPDPTRRQADPYAPGLGETVNILQEHGWSAGPGEFRGEAELTTDWARFQTQSNPWIVRLAGKIDPGRWDDLIALLTGIGWNFGAELRDGDTVVHNMDPARATALETSSQG